MNPTPEFLKQYFEYVVWADLTQLKVVGQLPAAEVIAERGFSFGSILKVMQHEIAAQTIWLDRFTGAEPSWISESPEIDTFEKVNEHWPQLHQRGRDYFAQLTPEILNATLTFTTTTGESYSLVTGDMVFHMCQHSYYHRSQLSSMIKLAGGHTVSTDYSAWIMRDSE